MAAVRRVSVFADKARCEVAMTFSGLSLVLSGKDIDCSTHAEETVFCAYQGGNLRIGFKAEFLKQTLENITTKEVQFKLSTQDRSIDYAHTAIGLIPVLKKFPCTSIAAGD